MDDEPLPPPELVAQLERSVAMTTAPDPGLDRQMVVKVLGWLRRALLELRRLRA